jgi:hypothetical protein
MPEIPRKRLSFSSKGSVSKSENAISATLWTIQNLQQCTTCFLSQKTYSAGGGASRFERISIRLGKDAESILIRISEHVATLLNTNSEIFRPHKFFSTEEVERLRDYRSARRCQEITDRGGRSAQTLGARTDCYYGRWTLRGDDTGCVR